MPCYRFLIVVLGLLGSAWAQTSDVNVIGTQNKTANSKPNSSLTIQLESHDPQLLENATTKIVETVKKTGGNVQERTVLQPHSQVSNVLGSPHVNKKSDHLVSDTYYREALQITEPGPLTINTLMKLDLAPSVNVNIDISPLDKSHNNMRFDTVDSVDLMSVEHTFLILAGGTAMIDPIEYVIVDEEGIQYMRSPKDYL
tara:strand:- start:42 stop:638 length:597 start_codon:yes stop_codon:yes gene_type:complete